MNHLKIAEGFIELCDRATDLEEVKIAFRRETEALGFRYFAYCSHTDPLNPSPGAVVFQSYPSEWVEWFSQNGFHRIDPVFQYADRTLLPFAWDSAKFRNGLTHCQRQLMVEAKQFGIDHGQTVPIHMPGTLPASCSVIPDADEISRCSYYTVFLMAAYMYEAIRRNAAALSPAMSPVERPLTRRQRQCLELAAHGKSDWTAGRILGISERTVHEHIENAKCRLGVSTRVQAVVHALLAGQIAFGDVATAGRSTRTDPSQDVDKQHTVDHLRSDKQPS